MAAKKRILLNWWYDRKDLIEPFLKLSADIEFICLFYKKPTEKELGLPFTFLFWGDFSSPFQLLEQAQPDEVVLFSIEDSPYQIALNLACRQSGIPTTLCDHGLRGFGKIKAPRFVLDPKKPQALLFLIRSVGGAEIRLLPKLLKLIVYKLSCSLDGRTDPNLSELRQASRYICFSEANARFFKERDLVPAEKIHLIGNPAFDQFFSSKPTNHVQEPYFLLIDQPLSRSKFNHTLFSDSEKSAFIHKLNQYSLSVGHRLFIKLHPDEYLLEELVKHPNIEYIREADVNELIWNCTGVYGFYSTLLLPAIFAKKCILFRINEMPLQQEWAELDVIQLLDFYHFETQDLDFSTVEKSEVGLVYFTQLYLYKTDGQAQQRLAALLLPQQSRQEIVLPSLSTEAKA